MAVIHKKKLFHTEAVQEFPVWFNVLFIIVCLLFMLGAFFRNLQGSIVYQELDKDFDTAVLTPLGFYHRGWGMFPGPTTQTMSLHLLYTYKDNSTEIKDYFPIRSSLWPSVWTEVMEDLALRDDNNDFNGYYQRGFFTYECSNARSSTGSPVQSIKIEQAAISLQEMYISGGNPRNGLSFSTKTQFTCPAS